MKGKISFLTVLLMFFILISGCIGNDNNNTAENINGDSENTTNGSFGNNTGNDSENADTLEIRVKMTFDGGEATAALVDNPATRSLLKQLPITVTCLDYAGAEKIIYFPEKLSADSSSAGYDPVAGDFTCYSPWGNAAVFYRDQPYAKGLIYMGKIESGLDLLAEKNEEFEMTIEEIRLEI